MVRNSKGRDEKVKCERVVKESVVTTVAQFLCQSVSSSLKLNCGSKVKIQIYREVCIFTVYPMS